MDAGMDQQAVDQEEAAQLTAHLVSFRSYPGQEGDVQRAVAAMAARQRDRCRASAD